MSDHKRHKSDYKIHETSFVSPIFDRAVPKAQQIDRSADEYFLKIKTEASNPSPFVVKLEKPKKLVKEELFQPLTEEDLPQEKLVINFDDLVAQAEIEEESAEENLELLSFDQLIDAEADDIDEVELELADFDEVQEFSLQTAEEEVEEPVLEADIEEEHKVVGSHFAGTLQSFRMKAIAGFTALSLMIVGPLQAMDNLSAAPEQAAAIEATGRDAFTNVESALSALSGQDFSTAAVNISQAEAQFSEMKTQFSNARKGFANIALLVPRTARTVKTADALIETGSELTKALNIFNQALDEIDSDATLSLADKVRVLGIYAEEMQQHTSIAVAAAENIDTDLIPENEQEKLAKLLNIVPALDATLDQYSEYSSVLFDLLGGEHRKDYLLLFNNTAEMRATGGFIGSYGEVTVDGGEIEEINIPEGGSYARQGQSTAFYFAPEPLQLINERWELQDANWYPDFPLSAKQALKLHAATGAPTMDGVISVNSTILPELLAATGPITLEDGQELNSENVLFFVRSSIDEANTDPETEEAPKAILGELSAALMEKFAEINAEESVKLFDVLISSLEKRDVQIYLKENEAQAIIKENGWSGEQKQTDGDYLQVVNTNIGGGKTDNVIDQQVKLHVDIREDGSVINTLTYEKTHLGLETSFLEGKNNVDFVRFYVPEGSEFLSAEGFDEIPDESLFEDTDLPLQPDPDYLFLASEAKTHSPSETLVWDENGKTVFGNWIQTKPGETEVVRITYKTPVKLNFGETDANFVEKLKSRVGIQDLTAYSLYLQKQSGITRRNTEVTVSYPGNRSVIWQSEDEFAEIDNEADAHIQILLK